jgi:starch synthase
MIAMRYGCVPVARRTGGLADTVTDAGDPGGTGLMFDEFHPWALWDALERALKVYAQGPKWAELQRNGMAAILVVGVREGIRRAVREGPDRARERVGELP